MLGSLILGLISWILPVINLKRYKDKDKDKDKEYRNWEILSISSMMACAISLHFQIRHNHYLVKLGDIAGIMDTMGTSTFLSTVLLRVTTILNLITLVIYGRE